MPGMFDYLDENGNLPEGLRQYFQYQSDEDARRFDANYGLQSREVGISAAAQKSTAAYQQGLLANAKAQLAENRRQFDQTLGFDREKFAEDTRRFGLDYALRQAALGADVLRTAASLRGPENVFQGQMYARGISGTPGLSPALASLRNGYAPSYGGGTATTGNPTPLTVGGLAQELSGQGQAGTSGQASTDQGSGRQGASTSLTGASVSGPTGNAGQYTGPTDAFGRPALSPEYQQQLDAINKIGQQGLANLPLGSLENLSPSELDTLKSGLDYLGRDSNSELTFYKRSRPGQGNPLVA